MIQPDRRLRTAHERLPGPSSVRQPNLPRWCPSRRFPGPFRVSMILAWLQLAGRTYDTGKSHSLQGRSLARSILELGLLHANDGEIPRGRELDRIPHIARNDEMLCAGHGFLKAHAAVIANRHS